MAIRINKQPHIKPRIRNKVSWCLLVLLFISGCMRHWEVSIASKDGREYVVNPAVLGSVSLFADDDKRVPVERILWLCNYDVIHQLVLTDSQGTQHTIKWSSYAADAWWKKNGQVDIVGHNYELSHIEVEVAPLLNDVEARISDIAPTVSSALGLNTPSQSTGSSLEAGRFSHALLVMMDGFGYMRQQEAVSKNLTPHLSTLPEPLLALTEYPPSTRVGTAAFLTGAGSMLNGVDGRQTRSTDCETLFDVASKAGLRVVAVEGDALAFNLRGAEVQLSGDRDGNGSTDDNVLKNALAVIYDGMPDLFFVHFHGIDDAGHSYGPGSPEEEQVILREDAAVGELVSAVPDSTLIIIFADHGMHLVEENGRLGNHGNLIERDMLIPIFIIKK